MTFIEAVVAISNRPDLRLCDCTTELSGAYPSICVYNNDSDLFIGKLRWPGRHGASTVDQSVIDALNDSQK